MLTSAPSALVSISYIHAVLPLSATHVVRSPEWATAAEEAGDGGKCMSATLKKWFDQLDRVLTEEAELAGLLRHGSMVGGAREFFVRRVLRSILPPSVYVGSGRVVSCFDGC